jgi:hypothetical protein
VNPLDGAPKTSLNTTAPMPTVVFMTKTTIGVRTFAAHFACALAVLAGCSGTSGTSGVDGGATAGATSGTEVAEAACARIFACGCPAQPSYSNQQECEEYLSSVLLGLEEQLSIRGLLEDNVCRDGLVAALGSGDLSTCEYQQPGCYAWHGELGEGTECGGGSPALDSWCDQDLVCSMESAQCEPRAPQPRSICDGMAYIQSL